MKIIEYLILFTFLIFGCNNPTEYEIKLNTDNLDGYIDNDGIRGTNPSPHTSNMKEITFNCPRKSQSAICYKCHTDSNAKSGGISGIGFCGYCHK